MLDFGQNLVGRVRFTVDGEAGTTVTLRHAEVLEHGEPAYRPLRNAEATDRYTLRGDGPETYEPTFTFHGFRYVEVDGWPGDLDPDDFVAVVLHSDMERTGTFTCDNELLNQLHSNVVWGMRGNFLDVPTDCPQRDERLGWTGDLQVFAPTAAFLYDVRGMLGNWLEDLRAEQRDDGTVPIYIPTIPPEFLTRTAGWSDAVTVVPEALHAAYGDAGVAGRRCSTPCGRGSTTSPSEAGPDRIWTQGIQLGDWLDPNAPPDAPFLGRTDAKLVATAYFARSAQIVSDAAGLLGEPELAGELRPVGRRGRDRVPARVPHAQRSPHVRHGDRLFDRARVRADRRPGGPPTGRGTTVELCRRVAVPHHHRIPRHARGAAGTDQHRRHRDGLPARHPDRADRRGCTPCSWARRRCGNAGTACSPTAPSIPGEMTSFNHYAFGCVAEWMHTVVGGLAPASPGYRTIRDRTGPRSWRQRRDGHPAHAVRSCVVFLVADRLHDRRWPSTFRRTRPPRSSVPVTRRLHRWRSAPVTTNGPTTSTPTSSRRWRDESWEPA